jgi:hypothetical protein
VSNILLIAPRVWQGEAWVARAEAALMSTSSIQAGKTTVREEMMTWSEYKQWVYCHYLLSEMHQFLFQLN